MSVIFRGDTDSSRAHEPGRAWLPLIFLLAFLVSGAAVAPGAAARLEPCHADSYDADADAVNLLVKKEYRLYADGSYDYHLLMRTRILTYRGKKRNGDVRIPYNSAWESLDIDLRHTRTILADGTHVAVREDEINDIQDPSTSGASIYSAARLRVVSFPSVEPGATVELSFTLHSQRPGMSAFWTREFFALTNPTREKVVSIRAPKAMPLFWVANDRRITVHQGAGREWKEYVWRAGKLPRAVDEPYSPPAIHMSPVLLVTTLSSYSRVAGFFNAIVPWREPGYELDALPAIFRSASDADSLYTELMSLFAPYVIDILDTDLRPQGPEATLSRGYGTPFHLAWLFHELLRVGGTDSRIAVVTGNVSISEVPLPFMPDFFSAVAVKAGGKWYRFNRKELSPGVTGLEGHTALFLDDASLEPVHDVWQEMDITTVDVSYDADGVTSGRIVSLSSGYKAADARRGFRYLSGPELDVARSMVMHSVDPLAQGQVEFMNLDDLMQPVTIRVDFRIPDPLPASGGCSFFPVPEASMLQTLGRLGADRKNPVWFPGYAREMLVFRLLLPAGARVEYMPAGLSGHAGPFAWKVMAARDGRGVYYIRELSLRRGMLRHGDEYERFRSALRRLVGPGQGRVMFCGEEAGDNRPAWRVDP